MQRVSTSKGVNNMFDIVAFGELLIDFGCVGNNDGYPILAARPGGAPGNLLATLSECKKKTAFIGKVGNDEFGKLLKSSLEEYHINDDNLILDNKYFTTLAFVTLDDNGERHFSFSRKPGADTRIVFDEVDLSIIDNANIFHFGTLSMSDNPAKTTTEKLVEYAREKGKLITFDPNIREPLWSDLTDAKKATIYGLKNADIVKISLEEGRFLFGDDKTPEDCASMILEKYDVKMVFVTCGKDGVFAKTQKVKGKFKALENVKTIDSTGAGDIFFGGAINAFLNLNKPIEKLDINDLQDICIFANAAAGLSLSEPGGMSSVPSMEEILKVVKIIPREELDNND